MSRDQAPKPVLLHVRITPRAARDAVISCEPYEILRISVKAPPVDGKANRALCRFLKKRLRIRGPAPVVVRGHSSRDKAIQIDGMDGDELHHRLRELMES